MIFLDTGFLFALVSKKDAHHKRAVDVFREFKNVRLADVLIGIVENIRRPGYC